MRAPTKVVTRSSVLRRLNERAIFEMLLRNGSASRSDLMRSLGVTAPTVHKCVAQLLEAGLLEEVGVEPTRGAGRPGMVYRVATTSVQVLGVALDVRKTSIAVAGLDGQIDPLSTLEFSTPRSYAKLIDAVVEGIEQFTKRDLQIMGIGVSTPGAVDFKNQKVVFSPNLHMTDGQSLSRDIKGRTGIDTIMCHETIGSCLSEWSHGAARGMTNFVLIGVHEGFGTSVIVDGRLLLGRDGMGVEMGHSTVDPDGERCGCGNRGCIETVATDQAFARRVSRRLGNEMSIEQIVKESKVGAIDIRHDLDQTLEFLAMGAASAINIFNPEAVLLSSRMFDADPGALERLRMMTEARALEPLFKGCSLIRAEGNVRRGAIACIIHHISGSIGPMFQ